MTSQKKAEKIAASLGVEIEREHSPEDRSYELQVAAPDGFQWKANEAIHLVETYYSYMKGGKDEAFSTLALRMSEGLENLDDAINPQ